MKQKIIYILSVMCFLSACSDIYEPDSDSPNESNMLSLSVNASQCVSDIGLTSRAKNDDTVAYTEFEEGDKVGVIVLDAEKNILSDNVPYVFDGTEWNFYFDNTEGKLPIYYDKVMSSYIVYFPYKPGANGCKSIDQLKGLDDFLHQKDQTTKEKYLSSDIMVWTIEDVGPLKSLSADLKHVYNTFSLAQPIVKWDLTPIGEEIEYSVKDESLKDVKIEFTPKNGTKITLLDCKTSGDPAVNLIYRGEDKSYRYLLPDNEEGIIEWQYTYRGTPFYGKSVIPATTIGTRFTNREPVYLGKLPGPKMQLGDFYCSRKNDLGENIGYVIPGDGEQALVGHHCVGLISFVGHHKDDMSDYKNNCPLNATKCQGYVISLTDTFSEPYLNGTDTSPRRLYWCNLEMYEKYIGTIRVSGAGSITDWSGYYNYLQIKKYAEENGEDLSSYPAAYTVDVYGTNPGFEAPDNTTGWFLPTAHMMRYLKTLKNFEVNGIVYENIDNLLQERFDAIKQYIGSDPLFENTDCYYLDKLNILPDGTNSFHKKNYWGTNEIENQQHINNKSILSIIGEVVEPVSKDATTLNDNDFRFLNARAFLVF